MPWDFGMSLSMGTGNPNRDGSGALVDLFVAGLDGAEVRRVDAVAAGATTPGVLRLFVNDGSASRLVRELLVAGVTPAAWTRVWRGSFVFAPPLPLQDGWKLQGATHNGESFNLTVHGRGNG